jgi:N-acetylmuramoyl-L-alanine amidase
MMNHSDPEGKLHAGQEYNGAMARRIRRFQSRGVRKADFLCTPGFTHAGGVVETGYITNAAEAKYLKKSSHQKDLANGIADGIISFIRQ